MEITDRQTLIAYLSTLAAIVILVSIGAVLAAQGKPTEAIGVGGAVTGLIGVAGTFRPRAPATGTTVQKADTVTAGGPTTLTN